jgi:hypothetical protein
MTPITLVGPQKLHRLLTEANAVSERLSALATASTLSIPPLPAMQISLSSASIELSDKNLQATYPRVHIYGSAVRNTQYEKFCQFSGTATVTAEIWASAELVQQVDEWLHYYVEAVVQLLGENIGDWKDGVFFGGQYDIQLTSPRAGGVGFVSSASVSCLLDVVRG